MNTMRGRVVDLCKRQHGVAAWWQLRRAGLSKGQIDAATRGLRRIFRGVCAIGELTEDGWLMAATLAMGPGAAISHSTAVMLHGLRPYQPYRIHVSVPGRAGRAERMAIVVHKPQEVRFERLRGLPITSPTQSLKDADLQPYELYRALEEAEERNSHLTLPLNDVVRLKQAVHGRTRSDAEARFILLCHEHKLPLPLVNHQLNGIEADFHWPYARLVLEVDGWEWHRERARFEEDRRRELVHAAAGYQVIRASGLQVFETPDLVVRAVAPSVL